MAKSVKLTNDTYWDSSGVIYDRNSLKTILDRIEKYIEVYKTIDFYNQTGATGWYEILRLGTTGGWGAQGCIFIVWSHNGLYYQQGYIEYYNNDNIQGRYIYKTNNGVLAYKKNSDNTVSVYCRVDSMYCPLHIKILSSISNFNLYNSGTPKSTSVPSGYTEFSNL